MQRSRARSSAKNVRHPAPGRRSSTPRAASRKAASRPGRRAGARGRGRKTTMEQDAAIRGSANDSPRRRDRPAKGQISRYSFP